MNIFITCAECLKTKGIKSVSSFRASYFEGRDSSFTCENGHNIAIVLKSPEFELLLESGASALLSGYTLEACVNYSTAIERFYNFAVKVMLFHLNIDDVSCRHLFEEISGNSERQFGAFLVLHNLIFGSTYHHNQELVRLIHKGRIPSTQQATDFCALVYQEIVDVSRSLQRCCSSAIQNLLQHDFDRRLSQVSHSVRVFSAYRPTLFSIESEDNKTTFYEALGNFIPHNEHIRKDEDDVPGVFNSMFEQISELRDIVEKMRSK